MTTQINRIAVTIGGGYISGLNAVITGAALAASELGWEVVGISNIYRACLRLYFNVTSPACAFGHKD